MQRPTRTAKLLAALLALGLFAAACSSGNDETAPAGDSQSTDDTTMMVGLDEGAPALQATLTDLLDSHVYLASIAVYTGVVNGLDSPEFKAAAATLDQNSVDLSKAIGSVYGPEAEEQFLGLWREHIGFFVDYAAGKATGDEKMVQKADKQLQAYTADFAAFLESATGLPADAGQEALAMHVASLEGAIDAVVAGDADTFDTVYEAASMHMPMTATALAGAIAAQDPEGFPGDVESPGAMLQQTLVDGLDSHVYLASIAVYTGVVNGLDSPEFKAAAATLDQNSVDLSKAIGSVYGPDAEEQFLGLWREHIGFFVDYAAGKATGDEKMAKKAQQQLDAYTADFAAFLESATGLPADAGQDALAMHVASLSGAIDAVVAGDGDTFDQVYAAAHEHMPMTAQALAGAIAAQNPEEYPAG